MFKKGDIIEAYVWGDWMLAEIEVVDEDGDGYEVYVPSGDASEWVEEDDTRSLKGGSKNLAADNVNTSEFDEINAEFEALQVSNDSDFDAAEKAYQAGVKPATTPPTVAELMAIGVL